MSTNKSLLRMNSGLALLTAVLFKYIEANMVINISFSWKLGT